MGWEKATPTQLREESQEALLECQRLREKCWQAREAFRAARVKLLEALNASREIRDRMTKPANS